MSRVRDAIRESIEEERYLARSFGCAWALGVDTLYKFKGFTGPEREHVRGMLETSRVYFSTPDQFNDPYDVAPVVRLGGDPLDQGFLEELEIDQKAMLKARDVSDAEIAEILRLKGVDIHELADGARDNLRREIREQTRIFCLTAERCHPLQWAHYADHHRGLCLHFSCARGRLIGLARKVNYRADRLPILIPQNRQSDDEVIERLVLVKAEFWSYEKEFRIIAVSKADWGGRLEDGFLQLEPNAITGVTIGMCMPAEDQADLLGMLNEFHPDLPVWKATEDFDRFWIRVDRIR